MSLCTKKKYEICSLTQHEDDGDVWMAGEFHVLLFFFRVQII